MAHALVFDSGVGGLSVVEELRAQVPDLHLSYAADDEFRPYGNKSEAALKSRLPGLLESLVNMLKPDVVVLACNTASTTALTEIRAALDVPVIGVVPAIKPAAQQSKTKAIAVLGTPGTVRHRYVDGLIADFADDCEVVLHGSTKLVSLAEQKLSDQQVELADIRAEIAPIFAGRKGKAVDTIVLACTHFPLLREELATAAPRNLSWIDSGSAIARRTRSVLLELGVKAQPETPETAFIIGEAVDGKRRESFKKYGFKKTVALGGYYKVP